MFKIREYDPRLKMNTVATTLHYNQPFLTPAVLRVRSTAQQLQSSGKCLHANSWVHIPPAPLHPPTPSQWNWSSLAIVFLQKLIQLSEPHSLLLDRILKLAYLRSAVNTSFLTDSTSSWKESLGSFSQQGIFSVSYLERTPPPMPLWPLPTWPIYGSPQDSDQHIRQAWHSLPCPWKAWAGPMAFTHSYLHLDIRTSVARQESSPRPGCARPFTKSSWCTKGRWGKMGTVSPSFALSPWPCQLPTLPHAGWWFRWRREEIHVTWWVLSLVGAATYIVDILNLFN